MSTETPKRKRGRPPGSGGGVSLNLKIPQHNFDYLTYLVERKSRLGTTVKEAAAYYAEPQPEGIEIQPGDDATENSAE
jgi:hypothetical protein